MAWAVTEAGILTGEDAATGDMDATQSLAQEPAADLSDDDRPMFADDDYQDMTLSADSDGDGDETDRSPTARGTARAGTSAGRSGKPVRVIPLKTFASARAARPKPLPKRTLITTFSCAYIGLHLITKTLPI